MASAEASDGKEVQPNQWGWSNMWESAKTAAEELSKKVADSAPQWQETAGTVMQNWGLTAQQVICSVYGKLVVDIALGKR